MLVDLSELSIDDLLMTSFLPAYSVWQMIANGKFNDIWRTGSLQRVVH
jgi:hypothetical protein